MGVPARPRLSRLQLAALSFLSPCTIRSNPTRDLLDCGLLPLNCPVSIGVGLFLWDMGPSVNNKRSDICTVYVHILPSSGFQVCLRGSERLLCGNGGLVDKSGGP